MNWFLDLSLVDGWLLPTLVALGLLAMIWLVSVWSRRFLVLVVPTVAAVSVLAVLLAHWIIDGALKIFPEPVPTMIYVWSGVILFGVLLAIVRIIAPRPAGATASLTGRIISAVAMVAVIAAGMAQINAVTGKYPTIRTLVGAQHVETTDLPARQGSHAVRLEKWRAPSGLPEHGRVATVPIPATASGFTARPAKVYLPPAYFAAQRPVLPVIVLIAGQPGSPDDWLLSAGIADTLDKFAARHHGVTPIVIAADGTGTELGNPLCMDSRLGNVDTYLSTHLAEWARNSLDAETDRKKWAVGGLSCGGTCALQLVTNHPDMYSVFLNMSGQWEPTLGDRNRTVSAAFGGNAAAFTAVNPVDLMRTRKYPDVAGVFLVGADDHAYRPGLERVYRVANESGMNVRFDTIPGGHDFTLWDKGFRKELPWLAQRIGIG